MKISQDLSSQIEQMVEEFAKDMAREIDFDVMAKTLVSAGWTLIVLEPFNSRKNSVDIANWVSDHISGKWHHCNTKFVFERAEDATATLLRWR